MKKTLIIISLVTSISLAVDVAKLPVISLSQDTLELHQIINVDQPTFIYLWATWCHVCRKEMPKMIEFFNEQSDVNFIPVAYTVTSDKVNDFLLENDYTLNTFIDYSGEIFREFGVKATPTVVILDQNNGIVFNGYKSIHTYRKLLKRLKN
ncbi:MAG: TlpA family protein disulfide reductase [Fidelibacterota bacterium]